MVFSDFPIPGKNPPLHFLHTVQWPYGHNWPFKDLCPSDQQQNMSPRRIIGFLKMSSLQYMEQGDGGREDDLSGQHLIPPFFSILVVLPPRNSLHIRLDTDKVEVG